ncbi:hypothetical protein R6Q59_018908 [Mikania micrantha]
MSKVYISLCRRLGATFFGLATAIIRSQRQLGHLDGSIPSPPQMIEEISTRKEDTTTKTLVKNPAKTRYVQLLLLLLDRGNERQLDQTLLNQLTYDRRISKSLILSDETENHHLVRTIPLMRNSFQADREEITKNHSTRSELPDRSAQLGKPLKPDQAAQSKRQTECYFYK